ncbi:MAG TPA: hypothetical protein VGJ69_11875 [Pyrinomonadaceae bacterium]
MKVRRASEQVIPEELAQRVADLTARVAELTRRLELFESVRGNGNGRWNQETDAAVRGADDSSNPIELVTENGFSIVRPWESGNSPAPTGGECRFRVSDASGIEREVTVEISHRVMEETSRYTRGHIQPSSSFWICCAERHLVDYVWEHDCFPGGDKLIVESSDPEEVMLAIRSCQKPARKQGQV